jgi:hypothetical protein
MNNLVGGSAFPIGTKVRVTNYPVPVMQSSQSFDFNGLVGRVTAAQRVGFGLNNKAVYSYQVFFEKVEVRFARKNAATGKVDKGVEVTNAQNFFEEAYLERVYDESNPKV